MRMSDEVRESFMKKAYETVLIIEDDADLRRLLESILTPYIKKVASGETLQSGWQSLDHFQPDLILLDNNLPDGQGIDAIREFKARLPETALVLISAMPHLREQALKYGADGYIEKPLKISDVFSLIRTPVTD
jgi:DNA-binding response OmpR family regulator